MDAPDCWTMSPAAVSDTGPNSSETLIGAASAIPPLVEVKFAVPNEVAPAMTRLLESAAVPTVSVGPTVKLRLATAAASVPIELLGDPSAKLPPASNNEPAVIAPLGWVTEPAPSSASVPIRLMFASRAKLPGPKSIWRFGSAKVEGASDPAAAASAALSAESDPTDDPAKSTCQAPVTLTPDVLGTFGDPAS